MDFNFGQRSLDLTSPKVMGILNVTPDSFSDGGLFVAVDKAMAQAEKMVDEGAAIIDVGGESTRPGAKVVSAQEEMDRVLPVIENIARQIDTIISVDTSTPLLMKEAANLGAGLINDVRALKREGAVQTAADTGLPVCLMHMQGSPQEMQQNPHYEHVVSDIKTFLLERIQACEAGGIAKTSILLDPGFGFGKSLEHNLSLLKHLSVLKQIGCPVLVGLSRKSIIEKLLNLPAEQRLPGSLALAVMAIERGATIVRVHDVAATLQAVKITEAVLNSHSNDG